MSSSDEGSSPAPGPEEEGCGINEEEEEEDGSAAPCRSRGLLELEAAMGSEAAPAHGPPLTEAGPGPRADDEDEGAGAEPGAEAGAREGDDDNSGVRVDLASAGFSSLLATGTPVAPSVSQSSRQSLRLPSLLSRDSGTPPPPPAVAASRL